MHKTLLDTTVEVDGEKQPHKFFSDSRDFAFSFAQDACLIFNRRCGGPSMTPLLVKLYNLHPSICTLLDNLLCVGEIPGPRQPKNLASFLVPFDDECAEMPRGVLFLDASIGQFFVFHGYQITEDGDIISVEKFLGLKGHRDSSLCPCRSCLIRGCRMTIGRNFVYYVPLRWSSDTGDPPQAWDTAAFQIPPRTHKSFIDALDKIEQAGTKKYARELEQHYGVKRMPALSRVNSLDYGKLSPWDWLHLFGANIIPHMIDV